MNIHSCSRPKILKVWTLILSLSTANICVRHFKAAKDVELTVVHYRQSFSLLKVISIRLSTL